MKTLAKTAVLVLSVSVMLVSTAMAQPGPRQGKAQGPKQGNEGVCRMEMIIPNLTDDQKATLDELRTEHFKEMKQFRLDMNVISAKQKSVMAEDNIDQKAADQLINEKTALINKQMKSKVAHIAAVKEVLNDEQLMALEQRIGKHQQGQKMRAHRPGQFNGRRNFNKQGSFNGPGSFNRNKPEGCPRNF